jgi:hypothetical protein
MSIPLAKMAQNSQRKEKKVVRVETISVNGWVLAIVYGARRKRIFVDAARSRAGITGASNLQIRP